MFIIESHTLLELVVSVGPMLKDQRFFFFFLSIFSLVSCLYVGINM